MRRNLKIYWLNFAVVLSVLAGSAVWQAREADKSALERPGASPDGRYHWAEVGRDVLLVIRNGEYEEIVTPSSDGLNDVVSSGFVYRSGDDLVLSDLDTGAKRNFQIAWDGIFEANSQTGEHRLFERCKHASARMSLGENPYSIDGVKLGMTLNEVESVWGLLVQDKTEEQHFLRLGDPETSVSLDAEGRVTSVSGKTLFENGNRIIDTDSRFDRCRDIGHEKKVVDICGYPYVVKSSHRTLDDYQVAFMGYNLDKLRHELGTDFERFAEQVDVDGVVALQLSYRYR